MHLYHIEMHDPKGWFTGPWDSDLTISLGYATCGMDDPHLHAQVTEIYLVARGFAELRVEQEELHLEPGDMVIVEPGEAHTFLSSSPDYFHFVIQTPGLATPAAQQEKVAVPRERLGLAE